MKLIKDQFKKAVKTALAMDKESRFILEAVCRLLKKIPPNPVMLDVGCADGVNTLLFAVTVSAPRENIHGIEPHEIYSKRAAALFDTKVMNIERAPMPWSDGFFDLVVCNQVLEHLANIFYPLTEMDRVLKVGGHLLVGVPNLAGLHNRLLLLIGRQPLCNAITGPHLRCFSHSAMKKFLCMNRNFELIAVDASSLYPLPWPLVDRLAGYFPGLSAYTFYLLKKVRHSPGECGWNIKCVGDTYF